MAIKIKILEKGDRVLNVLQDEFGVRIVVQKYNGEAYVCFVALDENGFPRIERNSSWIVTFGDGEIEVNVAESKTSNDESESAINLENCNENNILSVRTF